MRLNKAFMSIDEIIEKRKMLWNKHEDMAKDTEFREAVAEHIISKGTTGYIYELSRNPEKLIEMFFVIVDKNQFTTPFFFNDVQKKFLEILNEDIEKFNKGQINHLKYLVLKGRQQGFTSLINALEVAFAITQKNFSGFTLADSSENAVDIFADKGKFYFENIPDSFKPSVQATNRRELVFNDDKNPKKGLNSKWRVGTAGNKDAGRSKTLNFFHGSEVAFWVDAKNVLVGLSEAFTKNAIVILETTANGFNYYKELWDGDNNYKNLFFEWWLTGEYRLNFESNSIKEDFMLKVKGANDKEPDDVQSSSWVFSRLKWLYEAKNLDENQLYWYYGKWKDKGESIKQEYPCSSEEAFLASGRNFFSISEIFKRIDELKNTKPVRKGYFVYTFGTHPMTGEKTIVDDSISFIEDERAGYVDIFIEPEQISRYILSADTAGDGSDYNAAHVLNNVGKQFAKIHLINDEDLFADQLYCLGKMYNEALIAVESNFSTYTNKTLQNRGYPNLYTRLSTPDNITQNYTEKLGFRTDRATRPVLLARLKELVRDNVEYINDIETLEEMLTFIINENSKPEAMSGYHDDLIMSYGIGLYCLEQIPPEEVIKTTMPTGFWTQEELEDAGYPPYIIRQYMMLRGVR